MRAVCTLWKASEDLYRQGEIPNPPPSSFRLYLTQISSSVSNRSIVPKCSIQFESTLPSVSQEITVLKSGDLTQLLYNSTYGDNSLDNSSLDSNVSLYSQAEIFSSTDSSELNGVIHELIGRTLVLNYDSLNLYSGIIGWAALPGETVQPCCCH